MSLFVANCDVWSKDSAIGLDEGDGRSCFDEVNHDIIEKRMLLLLIDFTLFLPANYT